MHDAHPCGESEKNESPKNNGFLEIFVVILAVVPDDDQGGTILVTLLCIQR